MNFSFLRILKYNLEKYPERNAFFINEVYYTYKDLHDRIRAIYSLLASETVSKESKCIAVFTSDNLETYAAIMAVWFSGNVFVPLNPAVPASRNLEIIRQAGIRLILYSGALAGEFNNLQGVAKHRIDGLPASSVELPDASHPDGLTRYLIFTSGSTGIPKGVPITAGNLDSFIGDFIGAGYHLTAEDRCLQIYDFSFDASVHCYTVPLTVGACVYTVPQNEIKFLYAFRLMKEQKLTFIKMPPSTLTYLQPYFKEIRLDHLRYCLLGGEALYHDLVLQWSPCVPEALIQNVYGPTEATINCTIMNWNRKLPERKLFNGIVSIGKPFGNNRVIVADRQMKSLPPGEQGELCLAGPQVTPGYWHNPEKDSDAFFMTELDGRLQRFYRTGDLVIMDEESDLIYCGRIDEQVQVQGYRVELSEIEVHARACLGPVNVAAVAKETPGHTVQIYLFIENCAGKTEALARHLLASLPTYMQPATITNLDVFPKSAGGKVNKAALKKMV
jgi:amino acid adenylation domain-containing protein